MNGVQTFPPAEALLLDAWPGSGTAGGGRVAVLGVEGRAMAEVVAERAGLVVWHPRDVSASGRGVGRSAAGEGVGKGVVTAETVVPDAAGGFDAVLLALPQGRYLNRMLIAGAYAALREGGELWLAGPSSGGAKPAIADAVSLFGQGEVVAFKHRQRLARCVKGAGTATPDWATEPGVAPGTLGGFELELGGVTTSIRTRPGVFAWNGLDETTRLLLEHLAVPAGAAVANPCCGAGTIGLHCANAGADAVTLTDHDRLAVAAARAGVEANDLGDRVTVAAGACDRLDRPAGDRGYDLVVAFPPMDERRDPTATGRPAPRATDQVIAAAAAVLEPEGRLVLAVPSYVQLDKPLRRVGMVGRPIAESGRAAVIEARLAAAPTA
jgi:16S rRNA (guanine1207-N2)-methyltransferase